MSWSSTFWVADGTSQLNQETNLRKATSLHVGLASSGRSPKRISTLQQVKINPMAIRMFTCTKVVTQFPGLSINRSDHTSLNFDQSSCNYYPCSTAVHLSFLFGCSRLEKYHNSVDLDEWMCFGDVKPCLSHGRQGHLAAPLALDWLTVEQATHNPFPVHSLGGGLVVAFVADFAVALSWFLNPII